MMKDTRVKLTNTTGNNRRPGDRNRGFRITPFDQEKSIRKSISNCLSSDEPSLSLSGDKSSWTLITNTRIAAPSVAARTATELDVQVGDEVGYLVCFDRKAHPWKTKLGYMTDPNFNLYVCYLLQSLFASEHNANFFSMALMIGKDIHGKERDGNILVFFRSVEEVEGACNLLCKEIGDLLVLSLYSKLPTNQEGLILQTRTQPKCVCATNIAEVRITIDGIVYVIDLGKSKQSDSNPHMGLESLLRGPLSQAAARKRARRIKPGFCYRLYTHKSFMEDMRPSNQLEILESDTASHILQLKAMGFDDVARFDFFMDNKQWLFNIFPNQRVLEEATYLGSTTTQGIVLLVVRLENEM
ncbi:pre-mRNA-splicing factor ATP-dependent RNA helicase prp43 [Fusarium mexicanum]|uniref:Pre-mRNA-splicing factor ATP-dependent RNA helicase prp43 n=1 Tax=Fusarium mexicanum TaxID=751941 RepID=A0A8H5N5D5_9HYPO|nr:pre-mRNA-splicing factor ATP-dependent RNA helicase prp43 [Fusarium mexicanum]